MNNTANSLLTCEKIETIVLCALSGRSGNGAFGSLTRGEDGSFVVTADGRTFTARRYEIGWSIKDGNFEAIDVDLVEAARLACNATPAYLGGA